jgi:hypothetical protein
MTNRFIFNYLLTILCFAALACQTASAQTALTGGKGILRLYEAETVSPGRLYINPYMSFFAAKMPQANALAKDYTLQIGATLGFSRWFEGFLQVVPYQTDQDHLWGPPGDTRIGFKLHVPRRGKYAQMALLSLAKFPTGRTNPLPFEPYSENSFGCSLIGVLSYDFRRFYNTLPLKFAANLGYQCHDTDNLFLRGRSDQLVGGAGVKWLIRSLLLYSEVTGEVFINNSNIAFKQNSLRYTQGIKFSHRSGLIFDAAFDIELGRYVPTVAESAVRPRFLEDYADWKLIIGMTYRTVLFKEWDEQFKQAEKKQHEQENNLEQIREKRQKISKELEEYKKRLEEEKKEEMPF